MPVGKGPDKIEYGDRQSTEDRLAVTIELVLLGHILILTKIIAIIINGILLRTPSVLKLPEAVMSYIGPAEAEAFETPL